MIYLFATAKHYAEMAEINTIIYTFVISVFLFAGSIIQLFLKAYSIRDCIIYFIILLIAGSLFSFVFPGPNIVGNAANGWELVNKPSEESLEFMKSYKYIFLLGYFCITAFIVLFLRKKHITKRSSGTNNP